MWEWGLKKPKPAEYEMSFFFPPIGFLSFFLFFLSLHSLCGKYIICPLKQVLGLQAGKGQRAEQLSQRVLVTLAKCGEELLQPSCWEGWANGSQHFPNSANIN